MAEPMLSVAPTNSMQQHALKKKNVRITCGTTGDG